MCSLFVSAGQRVSFMKTAYYSTPGTNTTRTLYPEALDGHLHPVVPVGTLWEIDLESSYILIGFYISFKDEAFFRAVIEVYDSNEALIYTWRIGNQGSTNIIFASSVTTPVRYINVITEDATNASLTTALNEFYAYGECPKGTWGVQCRENCSSDCPDVCRFDDGLCNEVCIGYSDPPKCQTECQTGWFGVNCKSQCSDRCWSCNSRTGVCEEGCLGFSDPPDCTIECDTGLWGRNCASNCSRCFNSTCNSRSGLCDQGCLGYSNPPICTTECGSGYWGLNCTYQSCDGKS
uniref:Uncharacterized protein n=1 Tax=Biomphalaria glabrata TaxID=6526 RepID=A0A2C9KXZ3_BIOGL